MSSESPIKQPHLTLADSQLLHNILQQRLPYLKDDWQRVADDYNQGRTDSKHVRTWDQLRAHFYYHSNDTKMLRSPEKQRMRQKFQLLKNVIHERHSKSPVNNSLRRYSEPGRASSSHHHHQPQPHDLNQTVPSIPSQYVRTPPVSSPPQQYTSPYPNPLVHMSAFASNMKNDGDLVALEEEDWLRAEEYERFNLYYSGRSHSHLPSPKPPSLPSPAPLSASTGQRSAPRSSSSYVGRSPSLNAPDPYIYSHHSGSSNSKLSSPATERTTARRSHDLVHATASKHPLRNSSRIKMNTHSLTSYEFILF